MSAKAKPEKEYIDILQKEMETEAPHWLHPANLDWEALRQNQIKHRDKWLAEQKAKKKRKR